MKKEKTNQKDSAELQTILGALIGLDIILVTQMLGLAALDDWLRAALYCFVVAIPLLALCFLMIRAQIQRTYYVVMWYGEPSFIAGCAASLLGLAALFCHLSLRAGALFFILLLIGFAAYLHYLRTLDRVNR